MYTYRICIIHLGMYTQWTYGWSMYANYCIHFTLKTHGPRYPRAANTLFPKEISSSEFANLQLESLMNQTSSNFHFY